MSLSKGNINRTRPQKHQNRSAFKNDLHDTSKKTKTLNRLQVSGVCLRCKEIIEWKIKYKKYKTLTVPAKCVGCDEKTVRHAYHVLCAKCATEKAACAKCNKSYSEINQPSTTDKINDDNNEIETHLKGLPERRRRTILRFIKKVKSNEQNVSITDVDKMITNFDKLNYCDNSFSDDDCSEH